MTSTCPIYGNTCFFKDKCTHEYTVKSLLNKENTIDLLKKEFRHNHQICELLNILKGDKRFELRKCESCNEFFYTCYDPEPNCAACGGDF